MVRVRVARDVRSGPVFEGVEPLKKWGVLSTSLRFGRDDAFFSSRDDASFFSRDDAFSSVFCLVNFEWDAEERRV